jgi:hypothetical protein
MVEYEQKTFHVNREKANKIINYLQTYGSVCSGVFDLKEGGKVKIQPYKGTIEVMCNCDEETLNKLEGIANKK